MLPPNLRGNMDNFNEIITWLFVVVNTGRILAYLPQLYVAWQCKNGATSISRMTWGYFAVSHLTGILYSVNVLHDTKMALALFGNFLACCVLVGIVTWKKSSHAKDVPSGKVSQPFECPWGKPVFAKTSE